MSQRTQPIEVPIVFIGGGTMARAIIHGATAAGVLDPRRVAVAEPLDDRRAALQGWVGFLVSDITQACQWLTANESAPGQGQVLLAVKPQSMPQVAAELLPALGSTSRIVISIMAGIQSQNVRESLGGRIRIVRVMPNMPAQIARGMTAIARGAGAAPGDEHIAERLFAGVGTTVAIAEDMMDAYTALAGSGPAYIFYLAEAMVQAAVDLGFERPAALQIVRETIAGSGLLLADSKADPASLRDAVTSRGGTTAAATAVLEGAGVGDAFRRAIGAARDRGRELAGA
jgi:pyrroline-5-carboxylate reductase